MNKFDEQIKEILNRRAEAKALTVGDLIEKLKEYPPDLYITVSGDGHATIKEHNISLQPDDYYKEHVCIYFGANGSASEIIKDN